MKSSKTYSILFWLYTQNTKPGQADLYVRITINSKRANLSLKKKVDVSKWDSSKSRMKGNSQEARIFNQSLDKVTSDVYKCYQDLEYEGKLITSQVLKARYLGSDQKHKSLLELVLYHNQSVESKIHKNTLKSYKTSQKYLFSYLNENFNTDDIYLSQLNYPFLLGFETYLRNYIPTNGQLRIQNNTVMKHLQRLRKMVRMAVEMEWITRDPFGRFSPTIEKKQREFLTEFEIDKIINFDTSISRLVLVRDLFLFSCYTGLSYVDVTQLTKNNLVKGIDGSNWISTKRQKTKTVVKVPLLLTSDELIKKYSQDHRILDKSILFPRISNQKLNSYLKEISDICGITKNLTFHMARHTFATTVTLSNGVPIETVSKMLGHTKITTTQIYARVIERKVSEDMNNLRSVLKSKEAKCYKNPKINIY